MTVNRGKRVQRLTDMSVKVGGIFLMWKRVQNILFINYLKKLQKMAFT